MSTTYNVYGKKTSETGLPKILKENIEAKIVTIDELIPNTEYHFQVSAVNSAGESSWSDPLIIKTNPIAVKGVMLNKTKTSLIVGATETLTATISPTNATDKKVTWATSDATKATVTNGKITAVAEGSATITVTSASDNTKKATCTVTITALEPEE